MTILPEIELEVPAFDMDELAPDDVGRRISLAAHIQR